MYHIYTISDILRQRVDSLAQWLEQLDFYPGGPVSNPIRARDFFKLRFNFLVTNFHIRKTLIPEFKPLACFCDRTG